MKFLEHHKYISQNITDKYSLCTISQKISHFGKIKFHWNYQSFSLISLPLFQVSIWKGWPKLEIAYNIGSNFKVLSDLIKHLAKPNLVNITKSLAYFSTSDSMLSNFARVRKFYWTCASKPYGFGRWANITCGCCSKWSPLIGQWTPFSLMKIIMHG